MKTNNQEHFDRHIRQIQPSRDAQDLRPKTAEGISCYRQPVTDGWPRIAELLMPNVIQVLSAALRDAITAGVRSDDQVAELVGLHSGRWPLPDEYLSDVETFIISYCKRAVQPDKETQEFLKDTAPITHRRPRFVVFHHGSYHYYDELPKEVLELRDTALFWIYWGENQFRSRGEQRDRRDCPPARALKMLWFLCLERNAGRVIPLSELYSYVWEPTSPPTKKQICNSINVAENEINNFAAERFISDKSKNDSAKVVRIRGQDEFRVDEETPKECCIVKVIKSP
jgi:hypothetical protein